MEKNLVQVSSIRVVVVVDVVVEQKKWKSNKKSAEGNCFWVKHLEYVIFKEIIKFSTP